MTYLLKKFILYQRLIFCILIFFFFIYISWIYYQKAVLFSFVDEFNNFVSAYYMLQGKMLYKDIFFNHQMLMPYISYGLQKIVLPKNIYQYVLYHRLFIIGFSFVSGVILTYRFSYIGFFFVILYELTKYYCFGNLFLGESLVVYPLVYIFAVSWVHLQGKNISNIDITLSAIFSWFIIFLREPFIPVAVLLFCIIFWKRKLDKMQYSVLTIIGVISLILLTTVSLKDYIYQIITVNYAAVASGEIHSNNHDGFGFVNIFFYPFDILLEGKWTYFRTILVIIDIIFLLFISLYIYLSKYIRNILYLFIVLGLCAVRFVMPGTQYYEAYRLLPWYGIFLISTLLLIENVTSRIYKRSTRYFLFGLFAMIMVVLVLLPQSFIWDRNNREQDFHINYGQYTGTGDLMKSLADKNDTLFVEGWDSMVYLDAKISPAYPYIYYYPIMNNIIFYSQLKKSIFRDDAPDFYYICYDKRNGSPEVIKKQYVQLSYKTGNVCIHIKKEKFQKIPTAKINEIKQQGYNIDE